MNSWKTLRTKFEEAFYGDKQGRNDGLGNFYIN